MTTSRITTSLCFILATPSAAFQLAPLGNQHGLHQFQRTPAQLQAIAVPLDGPLTTDNEDNTPIVLPRDNWVANLDYDAFRTDVNALGKELLADTGDADVQHLNKILSWRNMAAIIGISTMWATPNPITIAALSTWTYASWTMGT